MTVNLSGQGACVRGTVYFTYTVDVTGGTALDTVLRTTQDGRLPATDAVAGSVRLDRQSLPAGRVTRVGADLVIRLGDLATGRHAVSFAVDVPVTLHARTSSAASLTVAAGGAQQSGPVVVDVNQTDLRLRPVGQPAGSATSLGAGRLTELLVEVDNAGSIDTAATLDISLPAGVEPGPAPVNRQTDTTSDPVDCRRTADGLQCPLGRLRPGDKPITLSVELAAAADSAPGTATVRFRVEPVPDTSVEAEPADNVLDSTLELLGTAALHVTITPGSVTLRPGQRQTFTIRLVNAGPQPTRSLFAAVELDQNGVPATFVSFTGPGTGGTASATSPTTGVVPARAHRPRDGQTSARPAQGAGGSTLPLYDLRYWSPTDLPAGGSVVARLVVRAGSAGLAQIRVTGSSLAGDPRCSSAYENCVLAGATVRVSSPPPPPRGTGSGPQLPNTGTPAGRLAVLAAVLLAVGAAACASGRRRRV